MLDDVLVRRPDYGGAFLERGLAKWRSGNLNGGLADFDKALTVLPLKSVDRRTTEKNKSKLVLESKGPFAAALALNQQITINPNDWELRLMRGQNFLKARQYMAAASDCLAVQKGIEKGIVEDSSLDWKTLWEMGKDCASTARFSPEGSAQRKKDCEREMNFVSGFGNPFRLSAGTGEDGRIFVVASTMRLMQKQIGDVSVEAEISLFEQTPKYSDRYTLKIAFEPRQFFSGEELARYRAMKAPGSLLVPAMRLHQMQGELVAPDGARFSFKGDNEVVKGRYGWSVGYLASFPTSFPSDGYESIEQKKFGASAFKHKRFRLKLWYSNNGAKIVDEDIVLPTDLDQRLQRIQSATTELKASATPGWC